MSLRFRLIGLVAIALMVSLTFGGIIVCLNASRSVRTEMRSALLVGRQTTENGIRELQGSQDPQRGLDDLVASFKGNRHLRVSLTGSASVSTVPVGDRLLFGAVPDWFMRLVAVEPKTEQVPVTIDDRPFGRIIIETDPHNEILEAWNNVNESVAVLTLFCGLTILLIYMFTGRALRPLEREVPRDRAAVAPRPRAREVERLRRAAGGTRGEQRDDTRNGDGG